jgi:hypothetical protein
MVPKLMIITAPTLSKPSKRCGQVIVVPTAIQGMTVVRDLTIRDILFVNCAG